MTILEPNQPWPQYYFRRRNFDGIGFNEGYEDKSVVDVVLDAKAKCYYDEPDSCHALFAGPRAWRKIEELISQSNWIVTETTDIFERRKKEFLGLELILTLDDGLWIA